MTDGDAWGICSGCGAESDLAEGLCMPCWDGQLDGASGSGNNAATNRYRRGAGKEYVSTYNRSVSAVEARKKYSQSEKGKEAQRRYWHSEKGVAKLEERRKKFLAAKRFADLEAQGLCGLCGDAGHAAEYHLRGE